MENYILNRKNIDLSISQKESVKLHPLIGDFDNYEFIVEHNSLLPLNLTFTFSHKDGDISKPIEVNDVKNGISFTVPLEDEENSKFYDTLEVKGKSNITLTIKQVSQPSFSN